MNVFCSQHHRAVVLHLVSLEYPAVGKIAIAAHLYRSGKAERLDSLAVVVCKERLHAHRVPSVGTAEQVVSVVYLSVLNNAVISAQDIGILSQVAALYESAIQLGQRHRLAVVLYVREVAARFSSHRPDLVGHVGAVEIIVVNLAVNHRQEGVRILIELPYRGRFGINL